MTPWYWAVRALPGALLCSTIVRAQEAPTLAAGTQVRAIVPLTANAADPLRCESRVVQAARDTLLLSRLGTCPLGTYNGAVSVLFVDHGSRWKHVAIGVASGAAIGGIIARLVAGDACADDPCDVRTPVGFMTIAGTVIGAASGFLVGARFPARGSGPGARVFRVGSVTLRPGCTTPLRGAAKPYDPLALIYRSDFSPTRISSTKSFGCSHAAKCPPLSSWL